jgi:hypothetical protein
MADPGRSIFITLPTAFLWRILIYIRTHLFTADPTSHMVWRFMPVPVSKLFIFV